MGPFERPLTMNNAQLAQLAQLAQESTYCSSAQLEPIPIPVPSVVDVHGLQYREQQGRGLAPGRDVTRHQGHRTIAITDGLRWRRDSPRHV